MSTDQDPPTEPPAEELSPEERDPRPAERSRRAKANKLNEAARKFYHEYWDVEHYASVEEEAGEFSHRDEDKSVLQILEYADIDVFIDTYEDQISIQEKFVQWDTNGDCLLIRFDNASKTVAAEAKRLKNSLDDPTVLVPGVFGYGRALAPTEFKWYWLVEVRQFVQAWDDGEIAPTRGTYNNPDGTRSLMFPPDQVLASRAVMARYGQTPDRLL
jgi:hypothetical protein